MSGDPGSCPYLYKVAPPQVCWTPIIRSQLEFGFPSVQGVPGVTGGVVSNIIKLRVPEAFMASQQRVRHFSAIKSEITKQSDHLLHKKDIYM